MATSEIDLKFLGLFASNLSSDVPLLSTSLYQLLGNLTLLSPLILRARKLRRLDTTRSTPSLLLYSTIIWYSREGLRILEGIVLPMVASYGELKVLAYKLRAGYYHLYVLFGNVPQVLIGGGGRAVGRGGEEVVTPPGLVGRGGKVDKGKETEPGIERGYSPASASEPPRPSSVQPTPPLEGGPVGGSFSSSHPSHHQPSDQNQASSPPKSPPTLQLIPPTDYRPLAHTHFLSASALSQRLLWGSHPLRLSTKVEYVAFLYDCLHERSRSREVARETISEVYNAQEGMDDEMFEDAAGLVGILGKMIRRGLGAGGDRSADGGAGEKRSTEEDNRTLPRRKGDEVGRRRGMGMGMEMGIGNVI